jgi:hypothetical protein
MEIEGWKIDSDDIATSDLREAGGTLREVFAVGHGVFFCIEASQGAGQATVAESVFVPLAVLRALLEKQGLRIVEEAKP